MKTILSAMALVAIGSVSLAASANATPAAAIAGIGEQASSAVEQVGYYGHGRHYYGHKYYGHKYYGYKHYGYGHGGGYYFWKKYCYSHPYHWKCERFGY